MKKKLLTGLVTLILLALSVTAAPAAAPMTGREIVEQLIVPMAVANDPAVGLNRSFSAEELAQIVKTLNENGITLPENNLIMQMYVSGCGLFEETVLDRLCEVILSRPQTLEEQDWYDQQAAKIGLIETYQSRIPGPENMTLEQAQAAAFKCIRDAYGKDLPLEDRNVWELSYSFTRSNEEDRGDMWYFSLTARDMEHGCYSVEFPDGKPEKAELWDDIPDWTKPYSGEELMSRMRMRYSWYQREWTQAVWRELHNRMLKAEIKPDEFYYTDFMGYRLTDYPDPDERDISREEAIRIAKEALNNDKASMDSAVLAEYAGERSWMVALTVMVPFEGPPEWEYGTWVAEIDSRTGKVRSLKTTEMDDAYIPAAAYRKAGEGKQTDDTDYIGIAVEAMKAEYPELDLLDETKYSSRVYGSYTHYVEFLPKTVQQGEVTVAVGEDGVVQEISADAGEPNGDNLFRRYWLVYGYFADWDQERWIQLEKDMADTRPFTVEGLALKATHFPEESSVKISREKAKELAVLATGKRMAEAHTCVLVDAEPHPVWISRVLQAEENDPVIGIDAETGEVVFREAYEVDVTPNYVFYSMPETWKRLTGEIEAPTPTPLPDGKPWYWGMDFAPKEFWDRAEAFLTEHGITEDNIEELSDEWDREYGMSDFWPQEYQSVYGLHRLTEDSWDYYENLYYPFPDPAKKSQKEINEIALARLHELADAELGKERVDRFGISSTLYPDSRDPEHEGQKYGKHVWWVWFYEWSEEDQDWSTMQGYAILDEDGNILTSGTGAI